MLYMKCMKYSNKMMMMMMMMMTMMMMMMMMMMMLQTIFKSFEFFNSHLEEQCGMNKKSEEFFDISQV